MASTTISTALFQDVDFDGARSSLEGRTKQVVSKSVLAATLRQHNDLLAQLVKAVTTSQQRISTLETELGVAKETIADQQEWIERLKETLTWKSRIEGLENGVIKLNRATDDHAARLARVEVQNEDWHRLKTGALPLQASQVMVDCGDEPDRSVDQELEVTRGRMSLMTDKMNSVEGTLTDLLQLAHRFDRLDQLGRSTADTQARLLVILKKVGVDPNAKDGGSGGLVELKEQMQAYTEEFGTIKSDVEAFRRQLVEKADMVKVEARIERKYEEIVTYLHEAIQAANDDEMEFRTVAETLQTTVKELMSTKADRAELLEMQGGQFGDPGSAAHVKTLQALIASKPDMPDVEQLVAERVEAAVKGLPPPALPSPSRRAAPDSPSKLSTVARPTSRSSTRPLSAGGPRVPPIDRDALLSDVRRLVQLTVESMVPEAPQGWALKGPVPTPVDPLKCISCNTPIPGGRPASLPHLVPPGTRKVPLDYTMGSTSSPNAALAATMGPGGTSLGGGFNVRVPDARRRAAPRRRTTKMSATPLTSFPSAPEPEAGAGGDDSGGTYTPPPPAATSTLSAEPSAAESKFEEVPEVDAYPSDGWKDTDGLTMSRSQLAEQGSLPSPVPTPMDSTALAAAAAESDALARGGGGAAPPAL